MAERSPIILDTQVECGLYLGVNSATISRYLQAGMPGETGKHNRDVGRYDTYEMVRWVTRRELVKSGAVDDEAEKIRRRQLELSLQRDELAMAVQIGKYRPAEIVLDKLDQAGAIFRKAGEDLQRMYGPEAADIINEAWDRVQREVIDPMRDQK